MPFTPASPLVNDPGFLLIATSLNAKFTVRICLYLFLRSKQTSTLEIDAISGPGHPAKPSATMPLQRRRRAAEGENPVSPSVSIREPATTDSSPSNPSGVLSATDVDLPPFLNTSFSTHRVSPLYIGSQSLTQERLNVLSQRLRDLLVGDVVRGVQVGLDRAPDDGAMRRAGALEAVAIGWVRLESLAGKYIGTSGDQDQDPDSSTSTVEAEAPPGRRRVLQISMQYENTECAALLLPTLRDKSAAATLGPMGDDSSILSTPGGNRPAKNNANFLHLPLLLLRMPAPLKTVIIDFISRTFDCRVSSLSLGTRSLVSALERWIKNSKLPTEGRFAKDIALTLGFNVSAIIPKHGTEGQNQVEDAATKPQIGLKTIDVIIPNQDLLRFLKAGEATSEAERVDTLANRDGTGSTDTFGPVKRRKLGGDKDEESWTWRSNPRSQQQFNQSLSSTASSAPPPDDSSSAEREKIDAAKTQPFIEALAKYLLKHLALDLFHPAVRVTKIACGGFVLSESRVKIFGAAASGGGAVPDTVQKAVWAVLDGLLDRADVSDVVKAV